MDEEQSDIPGNTVILCSTARLARSLRQAQSRAARARGSVRWHPVAVQTLPQWLERVVSRAMLAGEVPADSLPRRVLDSLAERLLWERAITQNTAGEAAQALFDIAGMAQSAAEANRLLLEWGIAFTPAVQTEETRQFLRWRATFHELCRKHGAQEEARCLEMQIGLLQQGAGRLPATLYLAGFDRMSQQEKRLLQVLAARGVEVAEWPVGLPQPACADQLACDNAEAECRAAAAWAARTLAENPDARLAIVVPELGALRSRLEAVLDDTLHPAAIHPSHAQMPRRYDFSLGKPLAAQPPIACALGLLRLAVQRYRLSQRDIGRLLRDPYWSAGVGESDARARLEARMRRHLGVTLHLEHWLRFVRRAQLDGLPVARLVQHLEGLQAAVSAWPKKQTAAAWATAFGALLDAAGWPGERSLASHEFQARQSWLETLSLFSGLGDLLGPLDAAAALRRFSRLCRERIFQPEAEGEPPLLVMGMLEAAASPLDALWVMGMNDHVWPPPARPNPLLPAEAQRSCGAPNSGSKVQAEFAQAIQRRLLHSAPRLRFSWSHKDGERELRPSPLLAGIPPVDEVPRFAATLAEQLAQAAPMQWLDDHLAPPVAAGEKVSGGTGLLKAQALCPAWAYYRYRLGARALDAPSEGLDALARGNLLHAVLQAFWQGRSSADLERLDGAALEDTIAVAVEDGVRMFMQEQESPLPPAFAALEKVRLQRLVSSWLEFERSRSPFSVQECERETSLEIEGLQVRLVLDRVDALPDGRLVVIDYKTGASVSHRSWAEERITEPQLPVYAALALSGADVAAVCFAKVRADERKFIGVAAEGGTLPGVDGLTDARKLFPEDKFPSWEALLRHWQAAIAAIAREVGRGEAAVRFGDENALRDCEVRPLLRLPERKLQMEQAGAAGDG